MPIISKSYKWKGSLSKRKSTDYIVLHHAASLKASADDIHRAHLNNGWTGIGYHFYVRKDGSIYTARPIDTIGAQTSSYNSCSVGICFEGNFEKESMSISQIRGGREIVEFVKKHYPKARIVRHKDLNATACPGKNFPFDKLLKQEDTDAATLLKTKVGLEQQTIDYLKAYTYGAELIAKLARAVENAEKEVI